MAEISKPLDINKIWSSGGDILAPSDSKIATGWQVEIPPRQYFNYIDNKQDQFNAHINQHGIAVWDIATEYQWGSTGTKSLCMGSNGVIYRAKQVSINQNPVTDTSNTYWEVAFASTGDFYSQTESDARYLQKASNLSDLLNTATARTNLSVYSQSQVDSKTTKATAAQAQAQTSDVVLMTPLQLANAFLGSNQNNGTNGYQIFPGGLIVQWGIATTSASADITVTFPTPFPNTVYALNGFPTGNNSATVSRGTASLTSCLFSGWLGGGRTVVGLNWIALGR